MKLSDLLEHQHLPVDVKYSLPPTYVMPQLQNNDAYRQYRHLIALAAARSMKDLDNDVSDESPWGENQAVICYTPADKETLKLANAIMGVRSEALTDTPSHERPETNTKSPVRKFVDLNESAGHVNGTFVDTNLTETSCDKIYDWCLKHTIPCIDKDKLHVTLLHSKNPVPKLQELDGYNLSKTARIVEWKMLGTCLVLMLDSPLTQTIHNFCMKQGGSHDYPKYIPHLSICYDYDGELPKQLPNFPIKFDKIRVSELDLNWKA